MDQNNQQKDYAKMDGKTIDTIKTSAIWTAVSAAITSTAGMIASYYFVKSLYTKMIGDYGYLGTYMGQLNRPQMIDLGSLIASVIYGAIGGAIAGWVIAKFYPVFVGWQKKYLNGKLNSFFKMMFWPSAVGFVISLVMTGALSMISSSFMILVINVLAGVGASYLYAKMMDKAVGKYYI